MNILAIDPGIGGGFAFTQEGAAFCHSMPEGMSAQADFIRGLVAYQNDLKAVMERTGTYKKGNSGPASVTFARHCGNLEAILYCFGIPTVQVLPKKWQQHFGTMPKDKQERKRAIKELMARRYPALSVTLKTADALAIWTYAQETGQL